MPIYEYVCLDCGQRFEALRSMRDADAPIPCQSCQGEHTSRELSLFCAHSGGRFASESYSGGSRGGGCSGCSGGSCATCH